MLKFASHRSDGDAIRGAQPVIAEYARRATDADKFRAAGLHQPTRVAGLTNEDTGLATLAERIRADRHQLTSYCGTAALTPLGAGRRRGSGPVGA